MPVEPSERPSGGVSAAPPVTPGDPSAITSATVVAPGDTPRPRGGRFGVSGSALAVALAVVAVGTVPAAAGPAEPVAAAVAGPATRADAGAFLGPFAPTAGTPRPVVATTAVAPTMPFTTAPPDERARTALATAMAQIGLPYVWGGDGPSAGDTGFDCSGLTTFSYAAAGVGLPRTAHTQYYTGPHVPDLSPLQPGDLVFYGTPEFVHHVGMYLGGDLMVNAPRFGQPVQVAYYRWAGDDYLGATRPAATGYTTGLAPYVPPPVAPAVPAPLDFVAPPAPPLALPPAPVDAAPPGESPPAAPPTVPAELLAPGGAVDPGPDAVLPFSPPVPTTGPTPTPTPTPHGVSLTLAGTEITLATVPAGADGLPAAPGWWDRPARPVVRLETSLAAVGVGSTVTLTTANGAAEYTITEAAELGTAEAAEVVAAAPEASLVLLSPTAGAWTIRTTSQAR